jgi:RimJ/RimL family protein N-acetyltransferase
MCARLHLPLYTPHLLLRDFVLADFQAIHAYASDPEATEFMFYGPVTKPTRPPTFSVCSRANASALAGSGSWPSSGARTRDSSAPATYL